MTGSNEGGRFWGNTHTWVAFNVLVMGVSDRCQPIGQPGVKKGMGVITVVGPGKRTA